MVKEKWRSRENGGSLGSRQIDLWHQTKSLRPTKNEATFSWFLHPPTASLSALKLPSVKLTAVKVRLGSPFPSPLLRIAALYRKTKQDIADPISKFLVWIEIQALRILCVGGAHHLSPSIAAFASVKLLNGESRSLLTSVSRKNGFL